MNLRFEAIAVALSAAGLCGCQTGGPSSMSPPSSAPDARQIVLSFYREALLEKQPGSAFNRYMAQGFIEHKPDVEGGTREAAAKFLQELMTSLPTAQWEVVRTLADGPFVVVHAKFTPAPGAPPYAIADFFKVEQGQIVEHWDVVAGPPRASGNPHSRF